MPDALLPLEPPRPVPAPPDATAVDETTEVHVTIGRIEITAVRETPTPRRRPASAKPMSLDEYLARRRGEQK